MDSFQPATNHISTSVFPWFLTSDYPFLQWHPRDARSLGTLVLSARFPSPRIPPHLAPSCCPPTHWLHSQEAFLLQHCPAVTQTCPSLCPTPGPTRERTALTSKTPACGETQRVQQRVISEKEVELSTECENVVASLYHQLFYTPCSTPFRGPSP